MLILRSIVSGCLSCLVGVAVADTGLKVDSAGGYWFGTEARLRLQAVRLDMQPLRLGYSLAGAQMQPPTLAASVTGDYYFSTDILDGVPSRSGLRASTALLIRQSGVSLSEVAWASRSAGMFGASPRLPSAGPSVGWADPQAYSISPVPYLGIGYGGVSVRSGWGFWADVGLLVQSPGNLTGLGRFLSGSQGVEDLMRELRLAPMVQLGVNYSF
jgi:hypothetical protein